MRQSSVRGEGSRRRVPEPRDGGGDRAPREEGGVGAPHDAEARGSEAARDTASAAGAGAGGRAASRRAARADGAGSGHRRKG
ncbi:hypothetical protein AB4212_23280, partial [Streptomyces sp. 2MCAF27]